MDIMNIGKNIAELRKAKGVKQDELARFVGVSVQAVCKWEQNTCYPDIIFLPHLAKILDCKIDDFFDMPCQNLTSS